MRISNKKGASQKYLALEKAIVTSVLTCAVAIASLTAPQLATASYLAESLEEVQQTEGHYFQAQFVPTYQQAMRADENHGNYTADLISYTPLAKRQGTVGDTTMVIWVNSVGLLGGLQSVGAMRNKSGLLWDTNDIGTDTSATSILVLGAEQLLLDDQLTLGFGKLFPGQYFLENPYNANNSDTYQNKLISGNPVTAMWESIGIGIAGQYRWQNIFTQFGIIDATAQEEIDFSSFFHGGNTWVWEWGWQETARNNERKLSAAVHRVNERDDYESEEGVTINAVYEWSNTQHAVFARYTWTNGGDGLNDTGRAGELPLKNGGHIGWVWSNAFGSETNQLGTAFVYGQPRTQKIDQDYKSQYGIEAYWRYQPNKWFHVTPDIQLLRNRDDTIETVLGLRLSFAYINTW